MFSMFAITFVIGCESLLYIKANSTINLDDLSYIFGLCIGILFTLAGTSIIELINKIVERKRKLKKE